MAERNVDRAVARELDRRGAWHTKIHGAGAARRGLPDRLAVYRGRAIVIETKARSGRPTRLQRFELARAADAGAIALIARDADTVRQALDDIDRQETAAA